MLTLIVGMGLIMPALQIKQEQLIKIGPVLCLLPFPNSLYMYISKIFSFNNGFEWSRICRHNRIQLLKQHPHNLGLSSFWFYDYLTHSTSWSVSSNTKRLVMSLVMSVFSTTKLELEDVSGSGSNISTSMMMTSDWPLKINVTFYKPQYLNEIFVWILTL